MIDWTLSILVHVQKLKATLQQNNMNGNFEQCVPLDIEKNSQQKETDHMKDYGKNYFSKFF